MKHAFSRPAFIAFALLFLFCGAFVVPCAHAGTLRIVLLDAAQVRGDVILLADLLPKDVPRFLREAAEKISLGAAPQNGTSRKLSRSSVLAAVVANGLQPAEFQIPDIMTVSRAAHSVTREEAFAVIRKALANSKDAALLDFQPEDLSFSPVQLPDHYSPLAVTDIAFDEFIGCARFRLRSASAPAVHPFYVTAQLSSLPSAFPTSLIPALKAGSITAPVPSPVLVEPGRSARLHLHSANSNIVLEVKPLQRGRLGEIIRVRLPSNGKTFRARVLETGDLNADF